MQEKQNKVVAVRYIMAITMGLIVPLSVGNLFSPLIGMQIAAITLWLYESERKESEAYPLGVGLSIISLVGLIGNIELQGG